MIVGTRRSEAVAFVAGLGVASLGWAVWYTRSKARGKGAGALAREGWLGRATNGESRRFVGIDLGGTTVAIAIVDDRGTVIRRISQPVGTDRSFPAVTRLIIAGVLRLVRVAELQMSDISAIGIGMPGNVDCDNGILIKAANFDWQDAPLTATLEQGLGRPAYLENDANAAVLAEWWAGAGAGDDVKHMVMFTLGTGIGGGVVSDNKLIRGATGMAGEFGHAIIEPCIGCASKGRLCAGTGVHGVLEQYCSARGMADRAKESLATSRGLSSASSLRSVQDLTSKDIFDHAVKGDKYAQGLVDETAEYIAVGLINACRAFDPQMIVVTGGLALAGDALLEPLRKHFLQRWWTIQPPSTCKIALATTGNDAGVIGAAAAARQKVQ